MTALRSIPIRMMATMLALPPARWRILFAAFLAVLLTGASIRYAVKATTPSRDGTLTRTAFLRWRGQIRELADGIDIYRKFNYPNPPVMALILMPFTAMPPLMGALGWFYLKTAMAITLLLWAIRLCSAPHRPLPDWAIAAVVLLSLHPILGDLSHGNVNIFIAFLVLAGLELFRRHLDISAGLVLGLAAACKVTPALFLPYLLWKRAWKSAAAMTVGIGLFLFVVPGTAFGWQQNLTLLTGWWEGMVRPFVVEGKVTPEHANQSIPGLVARLLQDQPSDFSYDEEDGKPIGTDFHNFTDIGPTGAKWIVRGFQAVFVVIGVWLFWTPVTGPRATRQGLRFGAEISLILLGMLLFSERTWKHHAVTLVVPFALLIGALTTYPPSRVRGFILGSVWAVLVLSVVPSLIGGDFQDAALVYGSHTAVFLILTAAVTVVLWSESRVVSVRVSRTP